MPPIDFKRLADALELHRQAYRILLWLGEHSRTEPELLSAESEAALIEPTRCRDWFETRVPELAVVHRDVIGRPGLAHMLASFFETSFHVKRLVWQGRLAEAELRTGPAKRGARARKRARHGGSPIAEALHRMCRDEGIRVSPDTIRRIMKEPTTSHDLHLWCYGVSLVRRSEGRGEGEADLALWRSMAWQERKDLNAEVIWVARARLLDVVRSEAIGT